MRHAYFARSGGEDVDLPGAFQVLAEGEGGQEAQVASAQGASFEGAFRGPGGDVVGQRLGGGVAELAPRAACLGDMEMNVDTRCVPDTMVFSIGPHEAGPINAELYAESLVSRWHWK